MTGVTWLLAIDFETSFSAATARSGGRAEPLGLLGAQDRLMPSAVLLDSSDRIMVGREAISIAGLHPARFLRCPKRNVGRNQRVPWAARQSNRVAAASLAAPFARRASAQIDQVAL